jgi:hypothetical protein
MFLGLVLASNQNQMSGNGGKCLSDTNRLGIYH